MDGNTGTSLGLDNAADGSVSTDATAQALGSVDAAGVIGSSVVASDGAEIGTVTDIATDANNQVTVTVDLAEHLGIGIDAVSFRTEQAALVDQQVRLGVTQAGFISSLQTHLGAQATGD